MTNRIEFYNKETTLTVNTEDYFVLNGNEVWRDNEHTYESQCAVVSFENFIVRCEDIGWRVI